MSRVVVVTGGSAGIGLGVAKRFADAGDRVVILGRRADALRRAVAAIGGDIRALACDVSDPAALESVAGDLPLAVDVLVHAAGANTTTRRPRPETLADMADAWTANLRANLLSVVLPTELLRSRMTPGGRVIACSSLSARTGGPRSFGYGPAQAALEAWVRAMAHELGDAGVTINAVAPGITDGTEFFPVPLPDRQRKALLRRAANGRAAEVEDIVAAVDFLASPGSAHVSGHVMPVDGGVVFAR